MNVLLIHGLWLWGELLGRPGKTISAEEAARAGVSASKRLPLVVAALAEGHDLVLVAAEPRDPWRRALDAQATERHVAWPAPAWHHVAGTLVTDSTTARPCGGR